MNRSRSQMKNFWFEQTGPDEEKLDALFDKMEFDMQHVPEWVEDDLNILFPLGVAPAVEEAVEAFARLIGFIAPDGQLDSGSQGRLHLLLLALGAMYPRSQPTNEHQPTTSQPNQGEPMGTRETRKTRANEDTYPCCWLIRVPTGNPEPDCIEDTFDLVDCGLPMHPMPSLPGSWQCEAGHIRHPIDRALAPFGPEWEAEEIARMRGEL